MRPEPVEGEIVALGNSPSRLGPKFFSSLLSRDPVRVPLIDFQQTALNSAKNPFKHNRQKTEFPEALSQNYSITLAK
jgi:hypothetical protein